MVEVINIRWQIVLISLALGLIVGVIIGNGGLECCEACGIPPNLTSTTIGGGQQYSCPDCPPLQDCPDCQCQICSTTPSTTTTSGTTYPTPSTYPVYASGGDYYTTSPTKIDLKWQMCNPLENVSVPLEYIIRKSNQTYNFTYLNGTTEIRYRANETGYKIIKGGCITRSANCCRVEDGGTATPFSAKVYAKYVEEVLGGCDDKPVVCPMVMRSPVGVNPTVACLEGRCQIVGRS